MSYIEGAMFIQLEKGLGLWQTQTLDIWNVYEGLGERRNMIDF
jgi:hypothetical protein